MQQSERASIALSMLVVLYALGFTNLFLRNSLGILAPALSADMQLSPEGLSLVASSFFFAYAFMQVPGGMLLDRFGARRTLACLLVFTTTGAALFAMASNVSELIMARVLMGIGCAGIFSGAFFVINQWVAQDKVVMHSGILNSFAAVGGLCATAPLAALITVFDWRACFWVFAGGVGILLLAVAGGLRAPPRDHRRSHPSRPESVASIFSGVARAVSRPGMKRLIVVGIPISTQTTIMGVWGAPYLRDVHALDDIARGNVMLAMAVSGVFGHTFYGWLARRLNSMKWTIVAGSCVLLLLATLMAAMPSPPVWAVTLIFATIGFAAMFPMIAFGHARGLVPAELVGRGVAVTNMGMMSAIAASQLVFGWIVGLFPVVDGASPEIAYRVAFAVQAGLNLIAMIIYVPAKDSRPLG